MTYRVNNRNSPFYICCNKYKYETMIRIVALKRAFYTACADHERTYEYSTCVRWFRTSVVWRRCAALMLSLHTLKPSSRSS